MVLTRALVLAALLGGSFGSRAYAIETEEFDWDGISSSRNLAYHPCYGEYRCARLTVPLDWLDESNKHTVSLAIIKLPASVPDDDPSFGGTIFTNPGGPGGSGVDLVLRKGHRLQDITSSGAKKYEILSWDPRGVARTSPNADCFGDDYFARGTSMVQDRDMGTLDSGIDVLARQYAKVEGLGKLCAGGAVNGSILPFLTTPSVARDMVEMVDKVEELRNAEAEGRSTSSHAASEEAQHPMFPAKKKAGRGVARIQYMGFSYGSILGSTFASMFPGRVGRLIIDGIADPYDYMRGTWLLNLQDAEKAVEYFYETCFKAGEQCPLVKDSDTHWQKVKARVDALIAKMDERPVSYLDGKETAIITGHDLQSVFIRPIYSPLGGFEGAAKTIAAALEGNFTLLVAQLSDGLPRLNEACALPNGTMPSLGDDADKAIVCGDGEDATGYDVGYFQSYVRKLKASSPTLGPYWATIRFGCAGWSIRPKWRFTGPFATPKHDPTIVEGKPAAPLLILSSRIDPVTPLANAYAASRAHPGSSVLVQDSVGHCSVSAPSECAKRHIQAYLEHGVVPKNNTICKADCYPWQPCAAKAMGTFQAATWSERRRPLFYGI